ncbi:MAG: carbohydrate kinase family protein [Chloroflexota bacterium]
MTRERDIDVLTVGGVDMDLVLTVPELPDHDEKVIGEMVGWLPGGPAANFACAASRLGLRVSAFAMVGDDGNGQGIIDGFSAYGVDTRYIQIVPEKPSPFTVIFIDPTGEKAIVVIPTEYDYPLDIAAEILPKTRVLYMMPRPEAQFLALAQLAHSYGAEVMIDIEATICNERSQLERILEHTDIACFNQEGFLAATERDQLSVETAQPLLAMGPHTVVVSRGKAGSFAVSRNEVAEQPGLAVNVVDTTGLVSVSSSCSKSEMR